MQPSLKRKLLAGTVLVSVAAFTGGAYAASQALNDNSRQAFLGDVAKRLNVTPAQLSAALKGAFEDQLQAAVKAGRLTQAQADALKQRIARFPNAPLGGFLGPSIHHGFGGPPGFAFGGARAGRLGAAAGYLGLTEAQLFKQLAAGKSLAAIAKAKGKSTTVLKAKMTAAATANLDRLRKAGVLSAAAEKQFLSKISARLDAQINATGMRLHFRHEVLPGPGGVQRFAPGGLPPGYPGAATLPPMQVPAGPSGPVY